ncbi:MULTISPECIES: hypothetical protein [Nostocaceae]|nr:MULTISPECIES: hypothetical protein [Nostocaceae]
MKLKTQILPKLSKVALQGRGFKPMFFVIPKDDKDNPGRSQPKT